MKDSFTLQYIGGCSVVGNQLTPGETYEVTDISLDKKYYEVLTKSGETVVVSFECTQLPCPAVTTYLNSKEKTMEKENNVRLEPENPKMGERKNDNKLRWRNVPMYLLEDVIKVGQFGESKYSTYNFMKGLTINTCLDSLKRHLTSFESPHEPDIDAESQLSHLGHIAWNAIVALEMLKRRPELDDRYKGEK